MGRATAHTNPARSSQSARQALCKRPHRRTTLVVGALQKGRVDGAEGCHAFCRLCTGDGDAAVREPESKGPLWDTVPNEKNIEPQYGGHRRRTAKRSSSLPRHLP